MMGVNFYDARPRWRGKRKLVQGERHEARFNARAAAEVMKPTARNVQETA